MKKYHKNIFCILCLFSAFSFSCESEKELQSRLDLVAAIDIAENLLNTTSEGLEEGDFAPGSQDQLRTRIKWAHYILESSATDEAYKNALEILQNEIEAYQGNTIKPGYPSFEMGSSLDLGKVSDYDIYDQFTVEYFVRFKDLSGNNLFSSEDQTGGIITRYNQGTVQAYIHNGGWVGGNVAFTFQPGQWYHIAFVFDGQNVMFYVDGTPRMTVMGSKNDLNVKDETHIKFGTHPTYEGRYFAGEIHHVSIWNFPKSPEQVTADMGKDYSGDEQGLLAYWPLDLNLGSAMLDKTGNHTAIGTQLSWISID